MRVDSVPPMGLRGARIALIAAYLYGPTALTQGLPRTPRCVIMR
jgi:hypothetical protein